MQVACTRPIILFVVLLLGPWLQAQSHASEENEAEVTGPVYVAVVILDVDSISSADQNFTINYYAQFRWKDPALAHEAPAEGGPARVGELGETPEN